MFMEGSFNPSQGSQESSKRFSRAFDINCATVKGLFQDTKSKLPVPPEKIGKKKLIKK